MAARSASVFPGRIGTAKASVWVAEGEDVMGRFSSRPVREARAPDGPTKASPLHATRHSRVARPQPRARRSYRCSYVRVGDRSGRCGDRVPDASGQVGPRPGSRRSCSPTRKEPTVPARPILTRLAAQLDNGDLLRGYELESESERPLDRPALLLLDALEAAGLIVSELVVRLTPAGE